MERETLTCPNPVCKAKLKKTGSSYVRCANCRSTFFSFCHEFPNRTSEYVLCTKCPNELYYFFCVKCKETLCFKNYRMGSVSKCKCGFEGCYVVCNNCRNTECFPPSSQYEGVPWCCEKCRQPFNFMTCDQCFHPIYAHQFKEQQVVKCENTKCKAIMKVKKCKKCEEVYLNSKNQLNCTRCEKRSNSMERLKDLFRHISLEQPHSLPNNSPSHNHIRTEVSPISQFVQSNNPHIQQKKSPVVHHSNSANHIPSKPNNPSTQMDKSFGKQIQSLCKVCLDKQADFINTKCFHMCVCQTCVPSMNNTCPLCRAEGQFKKVYR